VHALANPICIFLGFGWLVLVLQGFVSCPLSVFMVDKGGVLDYYMNNIKSRICGMILKYRFRLETNLEAT
jgi:hypothetical protein